MATGLLIVCCGKATKQVDLYQAMDKLYTGTLKLGEATPSYDAETEVEERLPWEHVTDAQVVDAAATFLGQIDQVRTTSPFQASMCSTRENSPSTPSSSPNRAFGDGEAALTGGLDGCDAAASHVLGDKGGREAAVQGGARGEGGGAQDALRERRGVLRGARRRQPTASALQSGARTCFSILLLRHVDSSTLQGREHTD
jgi:hypothetical protein